MIESKTSRRTVSIISNIILGIFAALCIIPIVAIVSISLSNQADIVEHGYKLIPMNIDFTAYEYLFKAPGQIINAYGVSIFVTLVGTIFSISVVALIAYPLSRADFGYKKQISFIVFFTLLFNGGMVPLYIIVSTVLGIKDTTLALILPYAANAWHILLLRTFFQKIPYSLIESAKIDGASEIKTFFSIVLPLSKPGLATIGLFILLLYWNDWWLSLLFIESQDLVPLQYMMYRIMKEIQYLTSDLKSSQVTVDLTKLPNESLRMALAVIAAGPMLFVFPFFQKYFVKGLTVGSIKE